jgi:hypothetical protein
MDVPRTGNRRWFQFSLRSLLIVVTAIACWLGYELNWIRERRAFLARELVVQETEKVRYPPPTEFIAAPSLLGLFGEPGYETVPVCSAGQYLKFDGAARLKKAARLFPEATIEEWRLIVTVTPE